MAKSRNSEIQQSPRTELARILLAIADPIRLRMLNLMLAGELSPEQFARALSVDEKVISRHLELFRESKMTTMRTIRNNKYYTVRRDPEFEPIGLLRLVVKMIDHDSALKADLAVFQAGNEENQPADPTDETHPSNVVEEIRLGF